MAVETRGEKTKVAPDIAAGRADGIDAQDPLPADTAFSVPDPGT
jgi:4-hydroxy-L-threonine phosphate dehydrogenase PdxA